MRWENWDLAGGRHGSIPGRGRRARMDLGGLSGHGKQGPEGICVVGVGKALRLAEERKGEPGKQCETCCSVVMVRSL